jgi:hypothetical protein
MELDKWPFAGLPGVGKLRFILFLYDFLGCATSVLTICGMVYVFKWLKETRLLLREIAVNTRAPRLPPPNPPEQGSSTAGSTPPKPPVAPADAKYMPKG